MSKAEELAEEAMEIIMSTKATDWSLEFLADIFQKYIEQYGRLVQEAAALACTPHNDDDAMDKQAKAECAKAIREMPLP